MKKINSYMLFNLVVIFSIIVVNIFDNNENMNQKDASGFSNIDNSDLYLFL